MKALKLKISNELRKLEHKAAIEPEVELSRNELDFTYRLSKTLCYLERAEAIIDGAGAAFGPEMAAIAARKVMV